MPRKRTTKTSLPRLIEKYYADLGDLAHQNVMYEMGTRPAFHALLMAAGKEAGWTLIAEHEKKVDRRTIRPDCPSRHLTQVSTCHFGMRMTIGSAASMASWVL